MVSILGYKALIKIQTSALIAVIVIAAVGGGAAYVFLNGTPQSAEDIRMGICSDLDMPTGKDIWQAAVLAVEQVNAEGGVLGRNFTVVAEDDDDEASNDVSAATNAMTKLITIDKADYVLSGMGLFGFTFQDICSEHRKILVSLAAEPDEQSQRVLDNYDKYKYYFSMITNSTAAFNGYVESFLWLRNYTGFNKVAYLDQDVSAFESFRQPFLESLSGNGFDIVYRNSATWTTTDFTSYLAAIEASGAEVLFPFMYGGACASFVKEWCIRESPFIVWGWLDQAQYGYFWNLTEGKCEYVTFTGLPVIAGHPLTNKTLATREAYFQRWQQIPTAAGVFAYDFVRFILPDAIERAGTTETEAIIRALEKTNVETSSARHFVFSSSHGVMFGSVEWHETNVDYQLFCMFQWQNGTQVPVHPEDILEEVGATYKYPPWQGSWSK
jgi:branched-chain amino acid transport system substrate-binding protein